MPPTTTEPSLQQKIIRFVIVGGIAFLLDAGFYLVLTRFVHVPYVLARSISVIISMIWNFYLNRIWTFAAQEGKLTRQATRFTLVMIATSAVNVFLMWVGVTKLHGNDILVLFMVSALVMVINFVVHQSWSYAKE